MKLTAKRILLFLIPAAVLGVVAVVSDVTKHHSFHNKIINQVAQVVTLGYAVTLGLYLLMTMRHDQRRRRKEAGLCMQCGYDLRASTDLCPECGSPIQKFDGPAPL